MVVFPALPGNQRGSVMVTQVQEHGLATGLAEALSALASAEGTLGHDYAQGTELTSSRHAARNLADAIHYFCLLHGRYPGVIELAASRTVHDVARQWMAVATEGFGAERAYLTRLVVAAGPLPSTPGQPECDATVIGQRHALDMLAQSDRNGCAFGAAAALVLEWEALRKVIDLAAKRFSVDVPVSKLPSRADTLAAIATVADSTSIERAMAFGAHQLLSQHRGLWDLLDARTIARGDY
jgi:hypothetical protein